MAICCSLTNYLGGKSMKKNEYESIRKELLLKLKFMDTTLKGVKESKEYTKVTEYNKGIMDSIRILEKYVYETLEG